MATPRATPTTAACSVIGSVKPSVGQELVVALGSLRIFAGPILSVEATYTESPALLTYNVGAIDWSWAGNS